MLTRPNPARDDHQALKLIEEPLVAAAGLAALDTEIHTGELGSIIPHPTIPFAYLVNIPGVIAGSIVYIPISSLIQPDPVSPARFKLPKTNVS